MKVRYHRSEASVSPGHTIAKPGFKRQFASIKKSGDVVPFNQRISSAANDKNLSVALQQWERIRELGLKPTPHTYCAMVNAFVRCGQLSQAERFVSEMERSVGLSDDSREGYLITLTTLLKGYFMSSAYQKSHDLFSKIVRVSNGCVGSRTLDTYLRGCFKTGAFEQGLAAFESKYTQKYEMSKVYAAKMLATRLAVKSACEVGGSEDAGMCVQVGCAYIRLGKEDRAREWFGRARELLFTSAPERQFDKLQKSELVRVCDFFTADAHKASSAKIAIDEYISRFIALSGDSKEQKQFWKSLGLMKFRSEEEFDKSSSSALESFLKHVSKAAHKKSTPVILEVCSGSGEWIAREASKNREKLYIAVEFRFDRCVDIVTRQMFQQLDNLWILCGDARRICSIIPEASLTELHVNYPEPPPVNVVNIEEAMSSDVVTRAFLEGVRPLLNGALHIVSDDKLYMHSVSNLVSDTWNVEVFPKSSKTLVDSYFARFFSKKAKRWSIQVSPN